MCIWEIKQQMKVLMVNKFLYPNGGAETYMFKLGNHLKSQGHMVEYFGMEDQRNIVGNSVSEYTSNMDFHNASLISKLKYAFKTIYSKEARSKIHKVLDNFNPDIIHLNNFNYQLTPSIILEIKKWEKESGKKCEILYTSHDYQLVCPNHMCNNFHGNCEKCLQGSYINCIKNKCIHGSLLKSIIGAVEAVLWKKLGVYKNIDKIICCSEFIKTKLDTDSVLADKTFAIHNFIDEIEVLPVNKEDYILYFGRFSKEKGIETLIDVCRQLPDIPFVFAGSGPLENKLAEIENITNVGFKTGDELKGLIRKARFSVYPSEWYENCPLSVMESIVYSTPVIASDIGGIPELVADNFTGELFESGNAVHLKEKIENLWNDKEKNEKYIENCAAAQFISISQYCKEIYKL